MILFESERTNTSNDYGQNRYAMEPSLLRSAAPTAMQRRPSDHHRVGRCVEESLAVRLDETEGLIDT